MRTTPQTYPEYKRTLISGLVNLPAHWQVARLKSLCKRHSLYGANIPATEYLSSGVRFLRTTDITDHGHLTGEGVHLPAQAVTEYILSDGDILVSRSGTVGRSFLYRSDIHGPCAYAGYLVRFVPKTRQIADYIYLFTKTLAFQEFLRTAAISSTIENVNAEKYANCLLPVPPPDEQAAIVRYLDHAEELISRYISAKERLISLLEEQRQAVIHQAVTRGIDPNVPSKQSSIPWLPKIPTHWEIARAKTLFQKQTRPVRPEDKIITCFRDGVVTLRENRRTQGFTQSILEIGYQGVRAGDLVIHNMDASAGAVGVSDSDGKATPVYSVCTVAPKTNAFFYAATLREMARNQWINALATGIRERSTGFTYLTLALQYLPLPPLTDQHAIVDHINLQTSKFTTEITWTRRQIGLMHEYRTRLIADVVTGQIDVRDTALDLPN